MTLREANTSIIDIRELEGFKNFSATVDIHKSGKVTLPFRFVKATILFNDTSALRLSTRLSQLDGARNSQNTDESLAVKALQKYGIATFRKTVKMLLQVCQILFDQGICDGNYFSTMLDLIYEHDIITAANGKPNRIRVINHG